MSRIKMWAALCSHRKLQGTVPASLLGCWCGRKFLGLFGLQRRHPDLCIRPHMAFPVCLSPSLL